MKSIEGLIVLIKEVKKVKFRTWISVFKIISIVTKLDDKVSLKNLTTEKLVGLAFEQLEMVAERELGEVGLELVQELKKIDIRDFEKLANVAKAIENL